MKISNIKIKNFRNLKSINIDLNQHTVLVGANGSGKSNLLYALRLILDHSLPDKKRFLDAGDFWEGLDKPFYGEEIEIHIEIKEFDDNTKLLACLHDALIDKNTAKLSFVYRPRNKLEKDKAISKDQYEFIVYMGNDDNKNINNNIRYFIHLFVLKALRDADKDFKLKYRSPLTPFLDRIYNTINLEQLDTISKEINNSSGKIKELDEIKILEKSINDRIVKMIGDASPITPSLGVTSSESGQMFNSLKLFLDNRLNQDFERISLGYANIIYLLLHVLNIEEKQNNGDLASCILGIEEPEAHLHPQMQRLIFKDIFSGHNSSIVTTHSPNIVSVAQIKSIVLLKEKSNFSEAVSLFDVDLEKTEIEDIQRYIDVTKGEIYFAKGVIFVEGIAERYLIPRIAELMGFELDKLGICVCSIESTNFSPYIKLVGKKGLNLPYVIITDGDLSKGSWNGYARINILLQNLGIEKFNNLDIVTNKDEAKSYFRTKSIFIGNETLEVDLIDCGCNEELNTTFLQINPTSHDSTKSKFKDIVDKSLTGKENLDWYLDRITFCGKGRFSQRLVSNLLTKKSPEYIYEAITKIIEVVKDNGNE